MPVTTVTSREFNQDSGRAKRAALAGPVFITDRGVTRHVLLSFDDYRRLTGSKRVSDLLASVDAANIEFEPPRLQMPIKAPDIG